MPPCPETRRRSWEAWARALPAALAVLAVLALLVAPLATPYWWDAGAVYAPGARWLLDHGFDARPGVFSSDLSRGHTPLFYLILAGAFRLLGPGPVAGHALALGFGWMAVLYTYALGRWLAGPAAGAVAAALLLTAPLFLTMSSEALPEVALTALTAASLLAFARGRLVECAAWGTLLVLVKETGVACPLAIAGAVAVGAWRAGDARGGARRVAVVLAPVGVLAAFFLYQKRAEGWFVLPYHAGLFHEDHPLGWQLASVARSIFVADGRLVAVAAAAILGGWRRPRGLSAWDRRHEVWLAVALHALMNLAFFTKMTWLERYLLPVHVGVVVAVAALLVPAGASLRARLPGLAAAALAVVVALSRRDAGADVTSGETTFRYLHAVHAYRALYQRLEAQGGDPVVLTDWPITDALRDPFLGWVERPFRVVAVGSDWRGRDGVDRVVAVAGLGSYERLRREARALGFHPMEQVSEGGASIELWGP